MSGSFRGATEQKSGSERSRAGALQRFPEQEARSVSSAEAAMKIKRVGEAEGSSKRRKIDREAVGEQGDEDIEK